MPAKRFRGVRDLFHDGFAKRPWLASEGDAADVTRLRGAFLYLVPIRKPGDASVFVAMLTSPSAGNFAGLSKGSTIILLAPEHFAFCNNVSESGRNRAGEPVLRNPAGKRMRAVSAVRDFRNVSISTASTPIINIAVHALSLFPIFLATDTLRRSLGVLLDEATGFGRPERPSQTVLDASELRLRRYDEESAAAGPVLLVPAPIKRGYIFDLLPEVSVVQRLLEAGFAIYTIEWREGANGDLETTTASLGRALERIAAEEGQPPIVIAHSLGGTLAAMTAALHPDRVEKLVLIQSPLRFGEKTGAVRPVAIGSAMIMRTARLRGQIPGSLLDLGSISAVPDEFAFERWMDAWSSLPDVDALSIHARVIRWSLDEFAPSAPLLGAVLDLLYSKDLFARDELCLLGRSASPRALDQVPAAAIIDDTSRLIPPSSALDPLRDPKVFEYAPETGVAFQHVGPLVGRRAHRTIWPSVIEWIKHEGRTFTV